MNFLCGNNSWIIILVILVLFCNNDCGCTNNSGSCGNSCGCNNGCGYCS